MRIRKQIRPIVIFFGDESCGHSGDAYSQMGPVYKNTNFTGILNPNPT